MNNYKESAIQALLDKELITTKQVEEIRTYHGLNLFSLHIELQLLMYLAVIMFTSGIGIIIYQNIESIGHIILLAIILILIVTLFYFCFKNSVGFKREETEFANPVFNYLVLGANVLSCIFIGYLQVQYSIFGTHYELATIVPTLIALVSAYYFDNKSVLSIGITGIATYIGLTISPQAILGNQFNQMDNLGYSALALGIALCVWASVSARNGIKAHFNLVFMTFALHLIGLSTINHMTGSLWVLFMVVSALSIYFFHMASTRLSSTSLFVFNLLYGFICFNILLYKLDILNFKWWEVLVIILPVYLVCSIILFIKLIKNFNKHKKDDNLQQDIA